MTKEQCEQRQRDRFDEVDKGFKKAHELLNDLSPTEQDKVKDIHMVLYGIWDTLHCFMTHDGRKQIGL